MSMDETALRSLAESMGMKKNSTDSKEEMAYFVIDNASAQVAREEAAKLKPRQKERKPRAKKSAAEPAATATLEPTGDAEPVAPKRRGRKPKAVVEAEKAAAAAGDADANVAQPATADNADQQLQPAKRRGRKPKAAVEEVPAEKNESSAPVAPEAVPVVKPKAVSSIIPGLEPDDLPLVLPVAPALKVAEKNVEAKEATPKEGRDVFVHQDNNRSSPTNQPRAESPDWVPSSQVPKARPSLPDLSNRSRRKRKLRLQRRFSLPNPACPFSHSNIRNSRRD